MFFVESIGRDPAISVLACVTLDLVCVIPCLLPFYQHLMASSPFVAQQAVLCPSADGLWVCFEECVGLPAKVERQNAAGFVRLVTHHLVLSRQCECILMSRHNCVMTPLHASLPQQLHCAASLALYGGTPQQRTTRAAPCWSSQAHSK